MSETGKDVVLLRAALAGDARAAGALERIVEKLIDRHRRTKEAERKLKLARAKLCEFDQRIGAVLAEDDAETEPENSAEGTNR